jgi:hypothetical protein
LLTAQSGNTVTEILATRLSDTEWRISDTTKHENDGRCVLGFVQQLGKVFEITRLDSPLQRNYVGSLQDALDCFRPTA